MSELQFGRVKTFLRAKAYGFITLDNQQDGKDAFFHLESWLGDDLPQPDTRVSFDLVTNPSNGKLRCVRVEPVDVAPAE